MTAEKDRSPFAEVPQGIDIARYFWHEIVLDRDAEPPGVGWYHGCDGIGLWREGRDYCYLWVTATVDHDMWRAYLLEVRTNIGGTESRDHLYLAAGTDDLFEVEWHNKPIDFGAPLDDHIDAHRSAMRWFVERDVGTIEARNGGDQGIIDRAAALVLPAEKSGE